MDETEAATRSDAIEEEEEAVLDGAGAVLSSPETPASSPQTLPQPSYRDARTPPPPLVWVRNRVGSEQLHPAYLLQQAGRPSSRTSAKGAAAAPPPQTASTTPRSRTSDGDDDDARRNNGTVLVKWAVCGRIEWVDSELVAFHADALPSRRSSSTRRRSPQCHCPSSAVDRGSVPASSEATGYHSCTESSAGSGRRRKRREEEVSSRRREKVAPPSARQSSVSSNHQNVRSNSNDASSSCGGSGGGEEGGTRYSKRNGGDHGDIVGGGGGGNDADGGDDSSSVEFLGVVVRPSSSDAAAEKSSTHWGGSDSLDDDGDSDSDYDDDVPLITLAKATAKTTKEKQGKTTTGRAKADDNATPADSSVSNDAGASSASGNVYSHLTQQRETLHHRPAEQEEQEVERARGADAKEETTVDQVAASTAVTAAAAGATSTARSGACGQQQYYPPASSAYVQALAEICHALLQDRRWTTTTTMTSTTPADTSKTTTHLRPLFMWEHGDDLSAVRALGWRYKDSGGESCGDRRRRGFSCTCLLCRTETRSDQVLSRTTIGIAAEGENGNMKEKRGDRANAAAEECEPCAGPEASSEESHLPGASAENEKEEDDDMAIYLYARLFYRKGPWFRLDQLYTSYYVPNMSSASTRAASNQDEAAAAIDQPCDKDVPQTSSGTPTAKENTPPHRRRSKADFFLPNKSGGSSMQAKTGSTLLSSSGTHALNGELVEMHLECVAYLLSDVDCLFSKGLVRSFRDEEECGKTVGVNLLSVPDRKAVLLKLGAKQRNGRQRRPSNPINTTSTEVSSSQQQRQVATNEIWKQMTCQTSLFGKDSVLPVIFHVNEVLLERLARTIVFACCSCTASSPDQQPKIPSAEVRQHVQWIKSRLLSIAKSCPSIASGRGILPFCLRLREEPSLTLQRCIRLYLCATSGPGEMRGDGTNGWRSLKDIGPSACNLPLTSLIPPPGAHTFSQVVYPPLAHRFGLRSSSFIESYQHCPVSEKDSVSPDRLATEQVFASRESFIAWELCVELRANVDYLLELNETLRYNERRRKRGLEAIGRQNGGGSVDFLQLLTTRGRDNVLAVLLDAFYCNSSVLVEELSRSIQRELDVDLLNSVEDACERILIVIAILATEILKLRNKTICDTEVNLMTKRPWLRHLWWDGCLAYILWDTIPILERCKLYRCAVSSLETLLFGTSQSSSIELGSCYKPTTSETRLAPLLISRRARGKGYDRLVIDLSHFHRKVDIGGAKIKENHRKEILKTRASNLERFCAATIETSSTSSSISFSSIRTLARRLKRPLSTTLQGKRCVESEELRLRFENEGETRPGQSSNCCKKLSNKKEQEKFVDWEPITDRCVANAISNDSSSGVGSRCSFVGYEDDGDVNHLNVEQLAMQLYNSGRLPASAEEVEDGDTATIKGGWIGWHDEGSKVRALFRILSSAPVLGMDWGCWNDSEPNPTLFLTPYLQAPPDLHVGFSSSVAAQDDAGGSGTTEDFCAASFYFRRRAKIEEFLSKLSKLKDQELCDLVYDSVMARHLYMVRCTDRKDPSLESDVRQLRTLSLIAAGCGGKQLASICRCLFFDYRHYSGGLPDLLMVRATTATGASEKEGRQGRELVDLGEWVGEGFRRDVQAAQEVQKAYEMLSDQDDEFLGCGKVGDSGNGGRGGQQRPKTASVRRPRSDNIAMKFKVESLPDRLQLVVGDSGKRVHVECMMVEVKSSNDRLDPRQEDWLNVLDRHGNARVCKFEGTAAAAAEKRKKKRPRKAANESEPDAAD